MTRLVPQTPAWYDRLATLQEGYAYPWHSILHRCADELPALDGRIVPHVRKEPTAGGRWEV